MITLKQISNKLAEAIKHSGMTQTELANSLGIVQPNISQYIKGKRLPALDTLANMCKILGLDANDVLCISD